jgi:hypothetical protein
MKTPTFVSITFAALALQLTALPGQAAPAVANTTTSSNAVPKSMFIIPASKKEGCDPFFPNSSRLWGGGPVTAQATTKQQNRPAGLDCLVLKGLSGTQDNRLAIVNGRTMARGEDAEINTDCGRILVHCVDITSNSAIIQVAGERRELKLRSDF